MIYNICIFICLFTFEPFLITKGFLSFRPGTSAPRARPTSSPGEPRETSTKRAQDRHRWAFRGEVLQQRRLHGGLQKLYVKLIYDILWYFMIFYDILWWFCLVRCKTSLHSTSQNSYDRYAARWTSSKSFHDSLWPMRISSNMSSSPQPQLLFKRKRKKLRSLKKLFKEALKN